MGSHFIDDSTVMEQFHYQVGSYLTIMGQPTLKNWATDWYWVHSSVAENHCFKVQVCIMFTKNKKDIFNNSKLLCKNNMEELRYQLLFWKKKLF